MKQSLPALMLIILATTASAYSITSTGIKGIELAGDNDVLAFVVYENSINKDLNNDDDTADHVIQYYDISSERLKNTGREGRNPSVHDNIIAFQDKSRRILYYDIEKKEAKDTLARGTNPSVYGKIIAFATLEKDEGDLNNDGDDEDNIIQYYDMSLQTTKNTDEIGANPLVLGKYIVFEASESKAGEDFNNDNDKDDNIIRIYDTENEDIISTKVQGTNPKGFQKSPAIITHNNQFYEFHTETKKAKPLNITGNNPSYREGVLAYERNGMLYIYTAGTERPLNISGTNPVVLRDSIAFIAEDRTISILQGEDLDDDNVIDYLDNCPARFNKDQEDDDLDGIGNACESLPEIQQNTTEPKLIVPIQYNITTTPTQNKTAQITAQVTIPVDKPVMNTTPLPRKDLPQNIELKHEKKQDSSTYWFLVAVSMTLIGIILLIVVSRWLKKKRKNYGF